MEKEKCEQILEIRDTPSSIIVKDITKDQIKTQFNAFGETRGAYEARHTETVDIVQMMDGTNEWESRAIDFTKEGEIVLIQGKGVGRAQTYQGEYIFMTQSKKLNWLNGTKAYVEGSSDMKDGGAVSKVYVVRQTAQAAATM